MKRVFQVSNSISQSLSPIKCIPKVRFKFRSQLKLLPPIRSLITFTVEKSIINRVSNVQRTSSKSLIHSKKKLSTRGLKNRSINWPLFENFPYRTTWRKSKNLPRNAIKTKCNFNLIIKHCHINFIISTWISIFFGNLNLSKKYFAS